MLPLVSIFNTVPLDIFLRPYCSGDFFLMYSVSNQFVHTSYVYPSSEGFVHALLMRKDLVSSTIVLFLSLPGKSFSALSTPNVMVLSITRYTLVLLVSSSLAMAFTPLPSESMRIIRALSYSLFSDFPDLTIFSRCAISSGLSTTCGFVL